MKNRIFSFLFILISLSVVYTQNKPITVTGKVIDSNNKIIKYCNISNGTIGTSTNEEGEFIFNISQFPAKLTFSHINYETKRITIQSNENITIILSPKTYILNEISLNNKSQDKAITLARNAYNKIQGKLYEKKYGKAFYRQKTLNDSGYYEFSEVFFDADFNRNGINNWNLNQGRYALKDGFVNNRNFTYFSRIIKSTQPETDDIIFPLHPNAEGYYDITIDEVIKSNNNEIAILWFKPKKEITTPIFEGEVYIEMKTSDVYKITGEIRNDDIELIKFSKKNASYKDYSLSYDMSFINNFKKGIVLDYLKIDQSFTYINENKSPQKVKTSSLITFFEYLNSDEKTSSTKFKNYKGDWKQLDDVAYDKEFWKENPIVKRTPVEEKVTQDFEKNYAFDELFINSRKQIASQQKLISNTPYINELNELMKTYNKKNQIEKIYIQTDKDIYQQGDTLSYFGYHLDGSSHRPIFNQNVVYVDLISLDDKRVITQKIKRTNNGTISGALSITEDMKSGSYKFIAYTNWMRNFDADFFFEKTIRINEGSKMNKVDEEKTHITFYPEGGNLIKNKTCKIAFKATNFFGEPKKVQGKIIDAQNNTITSFKSKLQGCGYFNLKPKLDEKYFAILENGKKYELPTVEDEGYSFSINNINDNTINIRIEATKKYINDEFYLLGHMYRDRFYQGKFKLGKRPYINIEIPKTKLPTGVLVFSILNNNKELKGERAVFVNNLKQLNINTKIKSKKDKITVSTKTFDSGNNATPSNLLISVLSEEDKVKKDFSKNITTYLNLESEIKGSIINPDLFLSDNKRATKSKADIIMLSHNCRKYNWSNMKLPTDKKFQKENFMSIQGTIKSFSNQLLRNTTVNLIAKSFRDIKTYTSTSDNNGNFIIPNFDHEGETQLIFEAIINQKSTNQIRVDLASQASKNKTDYKIFHNDNSIGQHKFNDEIKIKRKLVSDVTNNNIKLDEVIVTGKRKKKRAKSLYNIKIPPSRVLDEKDLENVPSLVDVIDRVPGVRIRGDANNPRILLNNSKVPPLFILDGAQIDLGQPITNIGLTSDVQNPAPFASPLVTFDLSTVERIEVLTGNEATMFGTRAMGGVILMYSKRGKNISSQKSKPLSNFTINAFDSTNKSSKLYNSNLYSITDNKEIKIKKKEELNIYIEGISSSGMPGRYIETISRK